MPVRLLEEKLQQKNNWTLKSINRMNNNLKKIMLLIGDIIILYTSLYLTLLIRYLEQPSIHTWQSHIGPFSITFLFWIIIFYIADLYNLHFAVNNSKFFQLTIRSVSIAGLLSAFFFYVNPNINIAPKTNLVIYLIVFAILFFLWRRIFNWLLNAHLPKDKLVIIGFNGQVKGLIHALQKKPHLGYKISAVITKEPVNIDGIKNINDISYLKEFILKRRITTIVLASDPHQSSDLRKTLFSCLPLKINIINLPNFYESVTGRVPIEAINQMWFLENLSEGSKYFFDFIKRIFDIFISLFILLVTAIFWPLIVLLLKIENKEPAFFIQARSGKNGKHFKLLKFRTQKTISNNPIPAKINDSRTTKIGNILRKTRIDEIPQVLNILIGDMSFIGPRPERPELIEKLENEVPFYKERMLVKPGLTGWDQVSGEYHSPSHEDTLKKLQYDLYYIKNRSLYLDLSIILKTIATILSRAGV